MKSEVCFGRCVLCAKYQFDRDLPRVLAFEIDTSGGYPKSRVKLNPDEIQPWSETVKLICVKCQKFIIDANHVEGSDVHPA